MACSVPCQQHSAICVEIQFVQFGALDQRFWAWVTTPDYCYKTLETWIRELYMDRFPDEEDEDPQLLIVKEVLKNSVPVGFTLMGEPTKLFHVLRDNDTLVIHTEGFLPRGQQIDWETWGNQWNTNMTNTNLLKNCLGCGSATQTIGNCF